MIELKGVNKYFGHTLALSDINLYVQEGEIFGLIGRSGAGKSTLLRSLNLLERPDSGEVIIDGQDLMLLKTRKLASARQKMTMIFQHFNLLNSKTVYDNIALPMRIQGIKEAEIKTKIEELLPLIELEDKAKAFPSSLSGGQKQRVAIARALSVGPKILLCDEATSALDPETTASILELLKRINHLYGLTIVMITHEMDVIKRCCHRLGLMEAGRLIEVTALATIFDDKKSLACRMLYQNLSPVLPPYLTEILTQEPNDKPLLRLFFQAQTTTEPFISRVSRELNLDINILLATVDHFDGMTCGVLIVELFAAAPLLELFIQTCDKNNITAELLGYVHDLS